MFRLLKKGTYFIFFFHLLSSLQGKYLKTYYYMNITGEIHIEDIEDITCPSVDTNFTFECSTRYLTRSLRSLVGYRVELEKIKFICSSGHVIFYLLYKHTNDDVFEDFPRISKHFSKISEDSSKTVQRPDERFRTFSENFRRLPKTSEELMTF